MSQLKSKIHPPCHYQKHARKQPGRACPAAVSSPVVSLRWSPNLSQCATSTQCKSNAQHNQRRIRNGYAPIQWLYAMNTPRVDAQYHKTQEGRRKDGQDKNTLSMRVFQYRSFKTNSACAHICPLLEILVQCAPTPPPTPGRRLIEIVVSTDSTIKCWCFLTQWYLIQFLEINIQ